MFVENKNTENYYTSNDIKNIVDRFEISNKSIIKIIGLIDRFRCKKCVLIDFNEQILKVRKEVQNISLNDKTNMLKILEPFLIKLKTLNENVIISYVGFKDDMYDSEYLLFKNIVEYNDFFIGNVNIKINDNTYYNIRTIYEEVKETYNIKQLLEFQDILFNLIVDIFYERIYDSLTNETNYLSKSKDQNRNLLINFQNFISKTMHSNCLTNLCAKIISVKVPLDDAIQNFSEEETQKLASVINIMRTKNNVKFIYPDGLMAIKDDPSLNALIEYILNNEQYVSFSQVIKILAYDFNYRDGDYNVVEEPDNYKNEDSSDKIETYPLDFLTDLRHKLFLFRKLINSYDENDVLITSLTGSPSNSPFAFTSDNTEGENKDENQFFELERYKDIDDLVPKFDQILSYFVKLYGYVYAKDHYIQDLLLP